MKYFIENSSLYSNIYIIVGTIRGKNLRENLKIPLFETNSLMIAEETVSRLVEYERDIPNVMKFNGINFFNDKGRTRNFVLANSYLDIMELLKELKIARPTQYLYLKIIEADKFDNLKLLRKKYLNNLIGKS